MTEPHRKPSRAGRLGLTAVAGLALLLPVAAGAASTEIERGRYLTIIGGCNDCHTAGYASAVGKVPEKDWLTGDVLGWRGPWGTTYPANLRLFMAKLSEKEWVTLAKHLETRPPMPWFTLQKMTDGDLRAIYKFVRSLGPAGNPAPAYLPPDKTPPQPYIQVP